MDSRKISKLNLFRTHFIGRHFFFQLEAGEQKNFEKKKNGARLTKMILVSFFKIK